MTVPIQSTVLSYNNYQEITKKKKKKKKTNKQINKDIKTMGAVHSDGSSGLRLSLTRSTHYVIKWRGY